MPRIADTDTETLLEWRRIYQEHLTWGLSKDARRSTLTKLGAVEYRLAERGVLPQPERKDEQ